VAWDKSCSTAGLITYGAIPPVTSVFTVLCSIRINFNKIVLTCKFSVKSKKAIHATGCGGL
jgi:hypothetical protein